MRGRHEVAVRAKFQVDYLFCSVLPIGDRNGDSLRFHSPYLYAMQRPLSVKRIEDCLEFLRRYRFVVNSGESHDLAINKVSQNL